MKKSVFTLLAIATMVVSMSSCSKDDAGSNAVNTSVAQQTQTTQTTTSQAKAAAKEYYGAKITLDNTLLSMGTFTLNVQADGKTESYDVNKEGTAKQLFYGCSKTTGNLATGQTTTSSLFSKKGVEFIKIIRSTGKEVKFSITFTPNPEYKAKEGQTKVAIVYGFDIQDSETASFNWDNVANQKMLTVGQETALIQMLTASASKTFTK